jgi:ubiquinone/menaquinone biosynthesis C-methylase UbiE
MIRSQRFFNKVSSHYQDLIADLIAKRGSINQDDVYQAIIEPRIGERVLDVGNGGVRGFDSPQISFYVGVDFNLAMLKRVENSTYYKVCAEAMDLPFKEGGFDTILYFFLLHHLAQGSIGGTTKAVRNALKEGSIRLKKGGNVIVAETCVPSFLEKVERAFSFVLRVFLFFTKQPEVFFFSVETLTRILTQCGYKEIRTWKISGEEENPWTWVRISIGLPFLKIPRWMNPSRAIIFEGRN